MITWTPRDHGATAEFGTLGLWTERGRISSGYYWDFGVLRATEDGIEDVAKGTSWSGEAEARAMAEAVAMVASGETITTRETCALELEELARVASIAVRESWDDDPDDIATQPINVAEHPYGEAATALRQGLATSTPLIRAREFARGPGGDPERPRTTYPDQNKSNP